MPRLLCLLAAAVLMAGAVLVVERGDRTLVALGRDLGRPVALPVLWRGLAAAELRGGPEEYVARGRALMRFVPQWTDGHIHFAWRLAFDASMAQSDPEQALSRLLSALALLEDALRMGPNRPADILEAMADFIEIRCRQDKELAAALRRTLAMDPASVADDPATLADHYLKRADRYGHSIARDERRVLMRVRIAAGRLRFDDRRGALSFLAVALRGLSTLRDQELAARWHEALQLARRHLEGDATVSLEDLEKSPFLEEICEALRGR